MPTIVPERMIVFTKKVKFLILLMSNLFVGGSLAVGQTQQSMAQSVQKLKLKEILVKKPLEAEDQNSHFKYEGILRLEDIEYLTDLPEYPGLSSSRLMTARMQTQSQWKTLDFGFDFVAGSFFSKGQSHLLLPQAFVEFERDSFSVTVGRQKMEWSHLDSFWGLGLWQPTFYIDTLRPEILGLTGTFFDYHSGKIGFTFLVSPFHVPSLGPNINEQDGALITETRWYRTPTREFNFGGINNRVDYHVEIPEQSHIVNQQIYALQLRAGEVDKGPWLRGSFAQKPVNDLVFKYLTKKVVDQDVVKVTVSPVVASHRIWSTDIGYSFESIEVIASYLRDFPKHELAEGDFVLQNMDSTSIYSAYLSVEAFPYLKRDLKLELSYMRAQGGGYYDLQSNGQRSFFDIFEQRLKVTNAYAIRLSGLLAKISNRALNLSFKMMFDSIQDGNIYNTELNLFLMKKFSLLAGMDVLGVSDETSSSKGFINQFRANDRIYGGMSYVF